MANNLHQLKSRLVSIKSTQKITKAMQLIAVSKLQKYKNLFQKNQYFSAALYDMLVNILSCDKNIETIFNIENNSNKKLLIVFSCDMGLAGGFYPNLDKMYRHYHYDYVLWIGSKGFSNNYNSSFINENIIYSDNLDTDVFYEYIDRCINMFLNSQVSRVDMLVTKYINPTSFNLEICQLLPFKNEIKNNLYKEVIIDPNIDTVIVPLIEKVITNFTYSGYLETKVCEYSSRQFAMDNATNNAQELIDDCQLIVNKVRQAQITQEITEIIGGSLL